MNQLSFKNRTSTIYSGISVAKCGIHIPTWVHLNCKLLKGGCLKGRVLNPRAYISRSSKIGWIEGRLICSTINKKKVENVILLPQNSKPRLLSISDR